MPTTSNLRDWIVRQYHDCVVADEPIRGTYGLIWFLSNPDSQPQSFALKTVSPEALTDPRSSSDLDYLRREFRMWLALPPHINVVPALGFDTAQLARDALPSVRIPVMRMPQLAGSLEDWVHSASWDVTDRLIALAQALNGLLHLYNHGFEGHGDLKPSNILYADLSHRFQLDDRSHWPCTQRPWQVRVADLGWADAWVDLGFTEKAFRQYLAPERLEGKVIPMTSDVFSMGIIAAELLQGFHPARNLKKAIKSPGEWTKCVRNGAWNFDGIESDRLKSLIENCVNYDPARRPSAQQMLHEICEELRQCHGQDIEATLSAWNASGAAPDLEHAAWAARRSIGLGPVEVARSIESLEELISKFQPHNVVTCEAWVTIAEPLIELLESKVNPEAALKVRQLRSQAHSLLSTVLGKMKPIEFAHMPPRPDWPSSVQPFERYSETVGRLLPIAGAEYEGSLGATGGLSSLALSALAFHKAGLAWQANGPNSQDWDDLLSVAITHAPAESVPYYFRARWRSIRQVSYRAFNSARGAASEENELCVADLQAAIRLSPDWDEPRNMLRQMNSEA